MAVITLSSDWKKTQGEKQNCFVISSFILVKRAAKWQLLTLLFRKSKDENKSQILNFSRYFSCKGKKIQSHCIHLIPKWPLFRCSFVLIQISPWCLVLEIKIQKNILPWTRHQGLIWIKTKEYLNSGHFGIRCIQCDWIFFPLRLKYLEKLRIYDLFSSLLFRNKRVSSCHFAALFTKINEEMTK